MTTKFKILNTDSRFGSISVLILAAILIAACGPNSKQKQAEIRPSAGTIAQQFAAAVDAKEALKLPALSTGDLGEFLSASAAVHEIMLELVGFFEAQYPQDHDNAMLQQWRRAGWRPFFDILECRVDGRIEDSQNGEQKQFRMSYKDRSGFARHTVLILERDANQHWKVMSCQAVPVQAADVGEVKSMLNKLRYSHGTAMAALRKQKPKTINEAIRLYSLVSNARHQELKPAPSAK